MTIKVRDKKGIEYESVSKEGAAFAEVIYRAWKRLGEPNDPYSLTGQRLLATIGKIWIMAFPQEYRDHMHDRAIDLKYEKSINDLVKENEGIIPVSYPPRLYQLIRAVFPNTNISQSKFTKMIVNILPFLKSTNTKI